MGRTILLTGGAGFIGSHVVRRWHQSHPADRIINLDALTYAGNLENLSDITDGDNYRFVKGDIADEQLIEQLFIDEGITDIIHLAAESHVDRSIKDPLAFARTNVIGTLVLLNAAKSHWAADYSAHTFYHISTDEVYGSLGATGLFTEETPYDPRSPYSASKASSDHFVRAFAHTYGMRCVLSNCSNNYGPNQFPEKLIPLVIHRIVQGESIPVYGDGSNVRDWLYVEDHAVAIDSIFHGGRPGETYNIGGHNEMKNLELVELLCDLVDDRLGRERGSSRSLITFVKDRPGHDQRYAIDATKIGQELNWQPSVTVETGMKKTVDWYLDHQEWVDHVTSGSYRDYFAKQYGA